MNILVLTNKPPYPPKDGGAIAVFNLAKGLADLGHKIHILAYNTSKHKIDASAIPNFKNLIFTHIEIDTEINPFAALMNYFFSKKPFNAERFVSKKYTRELTKILQADKIDIVQIEGPYLWFCVPLLRQYPGIKISLRAHNIEHEIWNRAAGFEKNFLKKIYLKSLAHRIKKMEQSIINQYDFVLPITKRNGNIFTKMGNVKPMHIVPAGINSEELYARPNENLNTIFYIGALDWIPNQEGLIWFIDNAWPLVLKKHPLAILHVAGRNAPGWFSNRISCRNVLYHGEVDDAYSFMEKAGIMVVPLFSGSGMRVKIIEGMALGKAIVSSSIGVEGIDIVDGQEVFIANDPASFADKIGILLESNEQIKKISLFARKCVIENYDNNIIANKLSAFYNDLLKK